LERPAVVAARRSDFDPIATHVVHVQTREVDTLRNPCDFPTKLIVFYHIWKSVLSLSCLKFRVKRGGVFWVCFAPFTVTPDPPSFVNEHSDTVKSLQFTQSKAPGIPPSAARNGRFQFNLRFVCPEPVLANDRSA
jgi:hypothetical protein